VREINSKINQDKITDAIDLAQQRWKTMGPDPNVTAIAARKRKRKAEKKEGLTPREEGRRRSDAGG